VENANFLLGKRKERTVIVGDEIEEEPGTKPIAYELLLLSGYM
jgi:hypothetical protein